jgi:hypothetical protein
MTRVALTIYAGPRSLGKLADPGSRRPLTIAFWAKYRLVLDIWSLHKLCVNASRLRKW